MWILSPGKKCTAFRALCLPFHLQFFFLLFFFIHSSLPSSSFFLSFSILKISFFISPSWLLYFKKCLPLFQNSRKTRCRHCWVNQWRVNYLMVQKKVWQWGYIAEWSANFFKATVTNDLMKWCHFTLFLEVQTFFIR